MGLAADQIKISIDAVSKRDKDVKRWVKMIGYPEPRSRPKGYNALLRTLVAQQVSVAAANSIYKKVEAVVGDMKDPAALLACTDAQLRSGGLSGPKVSYARALAEAVVTGTLNFRKLPKMTDDEAIASISAVRGFGVWSAEIYLMFAEGRPDIWPALDLGLQEGLKRLRGLETRPTAKATLPLVEDWRPHRSAMSLFCWHVAHQKNILP